MSVRSTRRAMIILAVVRHDTSHNEVRDLLEVCWCGRARRVRWVRVTYRQNSPHGGVRRRFGSVGVSCSCSYWAAPRCVYTLKDRYGAT